MFEVYSEQPDTLKTAIQSALDSGYDGYTAFSTLRELFGFIARQRSDAEYVCFGTGGVFLSLWQSGILTDVINSRRANRDDTQVKPIGNDVKSNQLGRLTFFFFFLFCSYRFAVVELTFFLSLRGFLRICPVEQSGLPRDQGGPPIVHPLRELLFHVKATCKQYKNQTATDQNVYASRVSVHYCLYKPVVIIIPVLARSLPSSARVKRQREEKKVGHIQNLLIIPAARILNRSVGPRRT